MAAYRVIDPPTFEPVTLAEARSHVRADDDAEENGRLDGLISAAREYCEAETSRALATQTIEAYFPPANGKHELPRPPLQSVQAVTYTDEAGEEHAIPEGEYAVNFKAEPGFIVLDGDIPSDARGITVTYTAGYSDTYRIPHTLKQAILLLVGHWYANREAVGTDLGKPVALAVERILPKHRVRWL